ncbi:MAG: hypothetical protein KF866_04355 [Phycisphaeraceae bacterium]|nr:hypothetical protein [Phycisphaeraceae bacterium]
MPTIRSTTTLAAAALAACACVSHAQVFQFSASAPDADRWNYPFGTSPGVEELASTFGATLIAGFDDYDAQFIVAWETAGVIASGLGVHRYHVERAIVRVTVANDNEFVYDDTFDSYRTFLPETDALFTPDDDPGRPIELWGVGYRGPFSISTWYETAPFGGQPVIPPAQDSRFAFASYVDEVGVDRNVSLRVRERFDADPFAIGTATLTPGSLVPADTEFTFAIDLCRGGSDLYLRRGLDAGVLRFTVASLSPADGGPGGGSGAFPRWYTRENPIAQILGYTAKLELTVRVGSAADMTGSSDPFSPDYGVPDGIVDAADFFYYLDLFVANDPRADLSGSSDPTSGAYGRPDCQIDAADFFYYLDQFVAG